MKNFKNIFFYVGVIGGFSALMYWIVLLGAKLEQGRNIVSHASGKDQWAEFIDSLVKNLEHPLAILLAQIVTIIVAARIFGWVFNKIGQPTVIGEIVAGIVLGPSLIGMYFPGFFSTLFPESSEDNLKILSQIGLILFMFVVGMELDLKILRNTAREAVVISHASIIFPFAMGMALAYFMYQSFAPQGIQFLSFALFMGIAMSITAFPVLARIVQERGIHKTKIGTVVITCAAADDITAWCILAVVIAIVKAGSFASAIYTILLAVAYVLLMVKGVRPFVRRVGDLHSSRENLSRPIVALFFLTLIMSAYLTEIIGIHALFGAFMAGAIMPDNIKFRSIFIQKVEDVALVLLLPLFFVSVGLRTEIGLLNEPYLWGVTGMIIVVAVVGKFIGSAFAAKIVGQNWKDSLTIGALMNTRGLMELVVLDIGYTLKVLTTEVFTMMVIMALVTTFMTGPALDLINFFFKSKPEETEPGTKKISRYKILFSFGRAETGRKLFRLATGFTKKQDSIATLTAMHLSPANELHPYNIEEYEKESFAPVIEESKILNQKVTTFFKAANDIDTEIAEVANKGDYDLLLVGVGQSIYEGSLLGKVLGFTTRIINPEKILNTVKGKERLFENTPFDERTQLILSKTQIPVGIFIDKDFTKIERVFIPVFSPGDIYLINYAQKLIVNNNSQVIVMDGTGRLKSNAELKERIASIEKNHPGQIIFKDHVKIEKSFFHQQDVMIISIESWKNLVEGKSYWLTNIPSTLIIADKNGM